MPDLKRLEHLAAASPSRVLGAWRSATVAGASRLIATGHDAARRGSRAWHAAC